MVSMEESPGMRLQFSKVPLLPDETRHLFVSTDICVGLLPAGKTVRWGGEKEKHLSSGTPQRKILKDTAPASVASGLSSETSWELSFETHEKSITKKLMLECPARFAIQQNQDDEIHWCTSVLYTQELRQLSFEKVQNKHSSFCNELRRRETFTPLYRKIKPDATVGRVPAEVDPRYAHTHSLVAWLRDNHHHKKRNWKPADGTMPRTCPWDSTILARSKTARIWEKRLAADSGIEAASDYLQKGVRVPPTRHSLENRSRPAEEFSFEGASPNKQNWQHISGVPSPRRFVGIGSEICSPRVLVGVGTRAEYARQNSAGSSCTGSTRISSASKSATSNNSRESNHSQTIVSIVTRKPDPATMTTKEHYATPPKAPRERPPPLNTQ